MSIEDDGGAAFPEAGLSGLPNGDVVFGRPGMTLRDYFAAKVMQARMTAFCALETFHGWPDEEIAEDAYRLADAMLKARKS